jgi:hypothetical protein
VVYSEGGPAQVGSYIIGNREPKAMINGLRVRFPSTNTGLHVRAKLYSQACILMSLAATFS